MLNSIYLHLLLVHFYMLNFTAIELLSYVLYPVILSRQSTVYQIHH